MKVFLDVGAHVGESLRPALNQRYAFSKIVCFEPVEACCVALEKLAQDNVEICRFGLWKESSHRLIHQAGSLGASLFSETSEEERDEVVEVRRASAWFSDNIANSDVVYLKLNCEGSECDILEDLLESGEIRKIRSALVDFDVRNVPALAHREREATEKLERSGYAHLLCLKETYRGPTHTATIENWLRDTGASQSPPSARWKWRYVWMPASARRVINVSKRAMRWLLPRSVYERIRRFVQRTLLDYPPDVEDRP